MMAASPKPEGYDYGPSGSSRSYNYDVSDPFSDGTPQATPNSTPKAKPVDISPQEVDLGESSA